MKFYMFSFVKSTLFANFIDLSQKAYTFATVVIFRPGSITFFGCPAPTYHTYFWLVAPGSVPEGGGGRRDGVMAEQFYRRM